jgi:hypothetical protein
MRGRRFLWACIMVGGCGTQPQVTVLNCAGDERLGSGERTTESSDQFRIDEGKQVVEERGINEWQDVCRGFSHCGVQITSRSVDVEASRSKTFGGSPVTDTLRIKIDRLSGRLEETSQAKSPGGEIQGSISSTMKCRETAV